MEKTAEIRFGTDGWRGMIAREFTFTNVRRVSQAMAQYLKDEALKSKKPLPQVVIGYDRRFQSETFAREVAKVFAGNKIKTLLSSEVLTTPAVSFLTHKLKSWGVMVTASHNPAAYNGIKIKHDGRGAGETITQSVEGCLDRDSPAYGLDFTEESFKADYLSYLKSRVNISKIKSQLKKSIVIDYMHGAAGGLLEEILPGKKIIGLRSKRDPLFGGHAPEPVETNLKDLMARVPAEKAALGVALDGDADRFALVDDRGAYLTPCQIFPLVIHYLVECKKIKGKIVQSVSMGYLAERMAKAYGLDFEELPVGFKHVAEALATGGAAIGGEESGGYSWTKPVAERDGLLTALLFLEMSVTLNKPISQLWREISEKYGKSFFKRVDYRLHKPVADKTVFVTRLIKKLPKKILGSEIKNLIQIDGLKIVLAEGHWLLMRPSGTEPLMRVYAESDSAERTQALLDIAKKWVAPNL
jgi:phosphomannomutase